MCMQAICTSAIPKVKINKYDYVLQVPSNIKCETKT